MKNSIDKLALGTVQFGMEYGINNTKGKPSREQSLEMLDFAYKNGIGTFDTAYNYGDAEEILGEFSETRGVGGKIKIITKLKGNIISESTGEPYDIIAANLDESLKRLKRDYVDGYLFHTPAYIRDEKLVDCFCKLKEQGLVKNIGVSIYEENDAVYAVKLDAVDYIQVPYSVFDERLDKTDFFQLAKKNGVTVFARSAFLQGLFFMHEEKIPAHLESAKNYLREFDAIIGKYGLSRQQAALLFSLKNDCIDYVVFGVDNVGQLQEDIGIAEQDIDCGACVAELKAKFGSIEKNIVMPSLWKK
jgi:aryl-alcohol dehydrogenase-like predicted oxidoreductase